MGSVISLVSSYSCLVFLDFLDYTYAELGYGGEYADGDQYDDIGHTIHRNHEQA